MLRHAVRLVRGRGGPDWLAAATPDWLAAAVRPRRAPVPWEQMLRAAIAICVPMSAGIASGDRVLGLLIAIGGLLGIVVDTGGAYVARLRRVGCSAFGGAAGITIGSLIHGRGWLAVLVLAGVAGISALLSAISDVGSVTGLQLLVYSSLGLGPIGALRPWWHTALGFILGAAWALMLTVPGWLLHPRAAERHSIAAVYRALATTLRAVGTPGFTAARRSGTATLNAAYDTLLTARSVAGGRSERLQRLMAVLNHGNLIAEATAALSQEGNRPPAAVTDALDRLAGAVESGAASAAIGQVTDAAESIRPPPAISQPPGTRGNGPGSPDAGALRDTSPGLTELREALSGLVNLLSGIWEPAAPPPRRPPLQRVRTVARRLDGRLTLLFALRLTVCVGVAGVASEVLPLQRSYWVVLTVAIVLKPDLGSVFARAVQRGLGTVIGAVLGAVILVVVPYGPWLLIPFGLLAALLPYGRSRNFGLMAVFLTPLVVLLIDLLVPAGWHLALDRLLDTLLGCAIALLIGYAPWPTSWQAHLPGQFAETIRCVSRYAQEALVSAWEKGSGTVTPAGADLTRQPSLPQRSRQRRRAYRALSDLRTEFERTMSEPAAVSRRATAWFPALVGLEELMDAVTAKAVAVSHGAPAPSMAATAQVTAALDSVADAVQAGAPPPSADLPSDEALRPVTDAARAILGVLASPAKPAAASRDQHGNTPKRSQTPRPG